MITVIIPVYNMASLLERALKSVLNQTYTAFEILVIDDGSTDNSAEHALEIGDERIRVVHQLNGGVSRARNRGIEEARGEWIAFLDADDEWQPRFLETTAQLAQRYPQCDVVATAYSHIRADGSSTICIPKGLPFETADGIINNYFEIAARNEPPICANNVVIRRSALLAIGGFPEDIVQGEDLLTWAKLALNSDIAYSRANLGMIYDSLSSPFDPPKRTPPSSDTVGRALESMARQHTDVSGIREYVALWHKMRANMFLRLPRQRKECLKEIASARLWNSSMTLLHYKTLLLLPHRLRMRIIKLFAR